MACEFFDLYWIERNCANDLLLEASESEHLKLVLLDQSICNHLIYICDKSSTRKYIHYSVYCNKCPPIKWFHEELYFPACLSHCWQKSDWTTYTLTILKQQPSERSLSRTGASVYSCTIYLSVSWCRKASSAQSVPPLCCSLIMAVYAWAAMNPTIN